MRRSAHSMLALLLSAVVSSLAFADGRVSLGFGNATLRGFPTGVVFVSGGGSYDPSTASNAPDADTSVSAVGGFRCLESVEQGPLAGCQAGEGVRWDTDQLLLSTTFKCTGAVTEPLKTAQTSEDTAVLLSAFYRAGDGDNASFEGVRMIITSRDLDPDIEGVQNIWIQGVGCGTTGGRFKRR